MPLYAARGIDLCTIDWHVPCHRSSPASNVQCAIRLNRWARCAAKIASRLALQYAMAAFHLHAECRQGAPVGDGRPLCALTGSERRLLCPGEVGDEGEMVGRDAGQMCARNAESFDTKMRRGKDVIEARDRVPR